MHRVYSALTEHFSDEVTVFWRVIHKTRDDVRIVGGKPQRSLSARLHYLIRTRFRKYFPRPPFVSDNTLLHSQALYPTGLGREINALKPDVVLLGWLGNSTLSIEEIGSIRAPVVWRLSDMWMFSGAEHYTDSHRYQLGYSRSSRPAHESGPDIDRETFWRKKKNWTRPAHIVSLTPWLERECQSSLLTKNWPTHVIPVPIDSDKWSPQNREKARDKFGLPGDGIVVLFGAGSGTSQPHKGSDLLFSALPLLGAMHRQSGGTRTLTLAIFGEDGASETTHGVNVAYLGRLVDRELAEAYSAANVFVAPSRLEAFGQVAAEAQACGAPVVAFDNSGLADVIEDGVTGKLATAFDVESLAQAISWVAFDETRNNTLGLQARARAKDIWNPHLVARRYVDVLTQAHREHNRL